MIAAHHKVSLARGGILQVVQALVIPTARYMLPLTLYPEMSGS